MVQTKNIFISYAREDGQVAEQLYESLSRAGLNPWLDTKNIFPGQRFKKVISEAIKNSAFFLALISSNSVNKRGYVQRELKIALDVAEELPPNHIFIIPVRIENIIPADASLQEIQWVDLFSSYEEALHKMLSVFCNGKHVNTYASHMETRKDNFNSSTHWLNLKKTGPWFFDEVGNAFQGSGMNNYLLSNNEYGRRQFNIECRVCFSNYAQFENNGLDTANAGIVLGWKDTIATNNPTYYHILFSGAKILLEEIGSRGGGAYLDFKWLDDGSAWKIKDNRLYDIIVEVDPASGLE